MRKILIWILISLGVLTLVFIFFGVPVLVQYFGILAGTKGNGDWLSFWGSYLGVIPSGLIAALVAGYQIKAANKQNDEARKQDLIMMRKTKILDYLYEIKSVLSKSKVILNTDKPFCSDQDVYNYLQELDHAMFESDNWKVLKDNHNRLYFLSGIVFDKFVDKQLYEEIQNYTESIKHIYGFIIKYEYLHKESYNSKVKSGEDSAATDSVDVFIQKFPDMVNQINKMFLIVDKKINELSA
ncbi:hypothetical protein [Leuconostoc citreum]